MAELDIRAVDCSFKSSDVMGLIFECLNQYEHLYLQGLNRRMFYVKVPLFVKYFYLPQLDETSIFYDNDEASFIS